MQSLVNNQVINPLVLGFSALITINIVRTLIMLKNQESFFLLHYIARLLKFESFITLSTNHYVKITGPSGFR